MSHWQLHWNECGYSAGYEFRGRRVFRGDIRPPKEKKASLLPYLVCFQPSVLKIFQCITREMCNSNPPIVCTQIQYISRSLAVTCNWLLQGSGARLISFFHHLNAEPVWKTTHSHPPQESYNRGLGVKGSCTGSGPSGVTANIDAHNGKRNNILCTSSPLDDGQKHIVEQLMCISDWVRAMDPL